LATISFKYPNKPLDSIDSQSPFYSEALFWADLLVSYVKIS